jgi:hypothetical protein
MFAVGAKDFSRAVDLMASCGDDAMKAATRGAPASSGGR